MIYEVLYYTQNRWFQDLSQIWLKTKNIDNYFIKWLFLTKAFTVKDTEIYFVIFYTQTDTIYYYFFFFFFF